MDKIITTFVDNGIEWLRQKDLLMRPDPDMPTEMVDASRKDEDDWRPWKPIQSTVTDIELNDLEKQIGHKFPKSYKDFLKYKHFYEVRTTDSYQVFQHVKDQWKETLLENIFNDDLKEFLLDNGYIWFGDYEDNAFLCFDTNKNSIDNEYPIVLIDHEEPEQQQTIYNNFLECLKENTVTL